MILVSGCPDNVATSSEESRYVPPVPQQLTPPPSVVLPDGGANTTLNIKDSVIEVGVRGSKYKPIQATLADAAGRRTLSLLVADNHSIEFADAGFHLDPAGATQTNGDIMICWNTLTGTSSKYNPKTPDPARGMALHCRLVRHDNKLGPTHRILVPTVGCWIQRVVALPDGGYRLLWKGDDGWFESDPDNPLHGTYESYYRDEKWTKPAIVVPVLDPRM